MTSPAEIVRMLGVEPASIRLVRRRQNTHWLVGTDDGERVVLRRYASSRTEEEIAFEHRVLVHLADRGWPVAPPLAPPLDHDLAAWCLFPYLPGRVRHTWTADLDAWRGELLAQLHEDLKGLVIGGQRDGWSRADEAGVITPEREGLLSRLRRRDRGRSATFELHMREVEGGLTGLKPGTLPVTVVHGAFVPSNLRLGASEELGGILDFDATRVDVRGVDLAIAIASSDGHGETLVDAYAQVSPIGSAERLALSTLRRADAVNECWRILADAPGDRIDAARLDQVLSRLATRLDGALARLATRR